MITGVIQQRIEEINQKIIGYNARIIAAEIGTGGIAIDVLVGATRLPLIGFNPITPYVLSEEDALEALRVFESGFDTD